jgi:hypothetical protein
MRIESGTTTEHRVRLGIFLAMMIVFSAYFGYDGLWGYPSKNLEWARQNIPNVKKEQKDTIQTNTKVLMAALIELEQKTKVGDKLTESDVELKLGRPGLKVERTGGGGTDAWYVGPAACACLHFVDGKLQEVTPMQNLNKSEADIQLQKVLGAILGVVSLVVAIYFIRIMTMKTVLDDEGLFVKGCRVAWDEMAELDTSAYAGKGWLEVVYRRNGDGGSVRLDSYHIAKFDEIVNTICQRKGFATPIKPRKVEPAEE